MSSYPPQGPSQEGQGMMFGSSQQSQPDAGGAATQLIQEVAPISSALQQLSESHPELSETIDQMLQLLKQGIVQSVSQMQQQASGPSYG
jgi:hypothetical protein